MSSQAIQIAGGVIVVSAFAASQLRLMDPFRFPYLAMNFVGTGILAAVAISLAQFGFVLTNAVWAVVSLLGLIRLARARPAR